MKLKVLSLAIALVLFPSCNKRVANVDGLGSGGSGGSGGTAEGFGGGNIYTDRLINLRNSILRPAVNYLVQGGGNPAGFCNFATRCPDTNNPLCSVDLTLTAEQINNCGTFLFRNLHALDAQVKSDKVVLEAVPTSLVVNGSEVVAATTLDEQGKIQVNIALMKNMSDAELAANLAHEYLHHVNDSAFGYVQDAVLYPALPQPGEVPLTGSNLLTAAGQEVVFQSQALAVLTNPPPPDPSSLVAVPAVTSISLNWTAGIGVTQNFQLAYSAGNSAPASCTSGTVIPVATVGPALTYRIEGLTPGAAYSFRVCGQANDLLSSGVTITASTLATPPAPPPNVTNLSANPSVSAVGLSWSSGGLNTQTYQIAYASGTSAPANCTSGNIILESAVGSSTSASITGLAPDTDYAFRVCAQANGVLSSGVTVLAKTRTAPTPVPPNPSGPSFVATANSLQLTWASGGGNTAAFQIAYSASGTAPSTCTTGTVISSTVIGNATSYNLTGLLSSKTYSFRLCATASGIFSSGVAFSATTLSPPLQASLAVVSARSQGPLEVNALFDTTVNFGIHPRTVPTDVLITLHNNGNGPASNFSADPVSLPFSILEQDNACSAGADCTVLVRFRTLVKGTFSNLLTLKYNNGTSEKTIQLSLTGKTLDN